VLLAAGDAAAATGPASGAIWYRRASELVPDGPLRPVVLAKLARALRASGDTAEAVRVAEEVLERAPAGLDRDVAAATLVGALEELGRVDEAVAVSDRLLADGPATAVEHLASRAHLLVHLDRFAEAEALVGDLPDEGRAAVAGLKVVVRLRMAQGRCSEGRAAIEQLRRAVGGRPAAERLDAVSFAALRAFQGGFGPLARELSDEAVALAGRLRLTTPHPDLERTLIGLSWASGEWDDALARGRTFIAEQRDAGRVVPLALAACELIDILVARGRLEEASALADVVRASPVVPSISVWALSALEMAAGRVERAADALADAWLADRRTGRCNTAPLLLSRLVEVEAGRGRTDHARRWLDELRRVHDLGDGATTALFLARSHSVVDGTAEAAEAAVAEVEDNPFQLARSLLELGTRGVDPAANLRTAFELFRRLDAEPWRRRTAKALRDRSLPVPRRPRGHRDARTDTERRLADLVRAGLSNREIAEAMFLSPKTVESYLSKLYAKTGVSSRVELAVHHEQQQRPDDGAHL
jgi:DNA-binding CsgD family transcriptional regulator